MCMVMAQFKRDQEIISLAIDYRTYFFRNRVPWDGSSYFRLGTLLVVVILSHHYSEWNPLVFTLYAKLHSYPSGAPGDSR